MTDQIPAQRERHYARAQYMGDGIWQAVCLCGWRGEATNDIAASFEANSHSPKPSLSDCTQLATGICVAGCPTCDPEEGSLWT